MWYILDKIKFRIFLEIGGVILSIGDLQGIIFDGHSAPVGGNIGNITWHTYTREPDTQLKNDDSGNFVIQHNERPFSGNKFKIDSNGNIHFNDAYKFPTSDGIAKNEVLSTDGSGTLSFTKTTHKETVSGATSYQIDHNLGEQYPIVQCWSTSTSQQEIPQTVTTNSTNRVTVEFYTTFARCNNSKKIMSIQITKVKGSNIQINPQIVKDQLQLYYDVGNRNSYTTGTSLLNMHLHNLVIMWMVL